MTGKMQPVVLGLDLGTSKTAAVLLNAAGRLCAVQSANHDATLQAPSGWAHQDVSKIIAVTEAVVQRLPSGLRENVRAVGVTGQMHGLTMVNRTFHTLTPLITWQDQRCDGEFLERLRQRTGQSLNSGYGCATLAWLLERGQMPPGAVKCATIQDYLAAHVCDLPEPVTDPTDGASWGLFNIMQRTWDEDAVIAAGIAPSLLPHVVECGTAIGWVGAGWAQRLAIPAGIPVAAPMGDNQATALATLTDPQTDIGLTMGTGGQVSVIVDKTVQEETFKKTTAYEWRPFTDGRYLAVGASLNAGAAWAWLVQTVQTWCDQLGFTAPQEEWLYSRLNELGLAYRPEEFELEVEACFYGERHNENGRGVIRGIDKENFELGHLAKGLARGIAKNLKDSLPATLLKTRRRVVGSGNALRRNPLLRLMAEEIFQMPVEMHPQPEETACGAAILAGLLPDDATL